MAKRTIQDRLSEALLNQGLAEHPVTTRSGWRKFGPGKASGKFYFVGPAGALRTGEKISDTISLQRTKAYKDLLRSVPV